MMAQHQAVEQEGIGIFAHERRERIDSRGNLIAPRNQVLKHERIVDHAIPTTALSGASGKRKLEVW